MDLPNLLTELKKSLQNEIIDYYEKCFFYIKDLYSYKNIDITTKFSKTTEREIEKGIYAVISATNSALNTIGIPIEELSLEKEIFNNIFKNQRKSYVDFNSFIKSSLKTYINKYLLAI
ncbi:MAG: hypothetical protein ACFFEO_17655, partial [Candidatus Thorarchaeota archaeon]